MNIFGGIAKCDLIAEALVSRPRGRLHGAGRRPAGGNERRRGQQVLKESGLNFIVADGMKDAKQ